MHYSKLSVTCDEAFSEILMAELAEVGFDTFLENESGFEAYAAEDAYDRSNVDAIFDRYKEQSPVKFWFEKVEKRNWNEEWERSYEPIIVDDRCLIRASFHNPDRKYPYELVITPKMSFGTGHHQTTYLMVKNQMDIDHANKRVMDAGCGTAILSIMAEKLGASEVIAFDIDEWSVINGRENVDVNQCSRIAISQGTIADVQPHGTFDIILANINRNVLLSEMSIYALYLRPGGILLMSGFYQDDIQTLVEEANRLGLHERSRDGRDGWAAMSFSK